MQSAASGRSATVRVNGLSGELCCVDATTNCAFWDLKGSIKISTGIPKREQRIIYKDALVHSQQTLASLCAAAAAVDVTLVRTACSCRLCGHEKVRLCSGCLDICYCSAECQRWDWRRYRRDDRCKICEQSAERDLMT